MNSNTNIKSNVYPMPESLKSDLTIMATSEVLYNNGQFRHHIEFFQQVESENIINSVTPATLSSKLNGYRNEKYAVCKAPFKDGVEPICYGPIKRGNEIVYGCRCHRKERCKYRSDCNKCHANKEHLNESGDKSA